MRSYSSEDIIWFKGKIIPARDAFINVLSPTAQFGLNVFEGIRGYWSADDEALYIFRLSDHLDRLFESCKIIGFECRYTKHDIEGFVRDVVSAGKFRNDVSLRLTLFSDGIGSWSS